jgi:hypothetical protein
MAMNLSCTCGKTLRVKEEWSGKRVQCPACGKVLVVPGAASVKVAAPAAPQLKRTVEKPPPDPMEKTRDPEAPRPLKEKRKKKKSKRRFKFSVPEFDILGIHMTLRKWIGVIIFVPLVGALVYFLWPGFHPKVLDARFVDAYAALEVKNPNAGNPLTTIRDGSLRPGGDKFLVVRETPEGEAVMVRLNLPPRFINDHGDMMSGELMIQSGSFRLQGDDQSVEPLLIELENEMETRFTEPKVVVDFSRSGTENPVVPRPRKPWFPAGEIEKNYEAKLIKPEDIMKSAEKMSNAGALALAKLEPYIVINGTGAFKGKRGLEVNYNFMGTTAEVTWDSQSKAYIGGIYQGHGASRFMLESLDMVVVFPRPAGKQMILTVMGDRVGKITPR